MRPRTLQLAGCAALVPAALYAAASDHGRPFMLGFLYGPESNHSTVGLILLAFALLIGPLVALLLGWRLRHSRRGVAAGLIVGAVLLLIAGMTTQQPYHQAWTLGPAAANSTQH